MSGGVSPCPHGSRLPPLSGGGLGLYALHPCTDHRQHGGVLSAALYALPHSGRVLSQPLPPYALTAHACPLSGGGLGRCVPPATPSRRVCPPFIFVHILFTFTPALNH